MEELDHAAVQLRTALRLLIRRSYTVTGNKAPTRSEQGVMAWLDEKGPMTPRTLADLEKVRPQTLGQTLDALDRHQWIKRTAHPTDRRQILISLSAAGRKTLTQGRKRRQTWLVEQLGKLNSTDQKTLIAAIAILNRIAQS